LKQRGIPGKGTFQGNMQGSFSPVGTHKTVMFAGRRLVAAVTGLQPFVSHLSIPRVWQPAPPAVHGYGHGHAWPTNLQQAHKPSQQRQWQQQTQQQQETSMQLKKRVRRARQRRQQKQRRQQQRQQVARFAPPAPYLDNEFYMARAERERQEQGVRQMDYFLYPAAAAAGAVDHELVLFAPAAPLITNEMLMARAEQERAETAALQLQQQAVSGVIEPPTPATEEQLPAAKQPAAVIAPVSSFSIAAAVVAPAAVATPFALQQYQQLEQQLQNVQLQEASCSQQQQQQQDEEEEQQQDEDANYTLEEVCVWYSGVQASLKSTQRVNLPVHVAMRQPDAPGFFSVLTRTVSDASSCC
jgi:hypothetical protein